MQTLFKGQPTPVAVRDRRNSSFIYMIEAETGAHVWADCCDGAVEDVFDLKDKITQNAAAAALP
jgi:TolB-like protein